MTMGRADKTLEFITKQGVKLTKEVRITSDEAYYGSVSTSYILKLKTFETEKVVYGAIFVYKGRKYSVSTVIEDLPIYRKPAEVTAVCVERNGKNKPQN